jgi:RimJ/RimL family protein N-acetyltransferase
VSRKRIKSSAEVDSAVSYIGNLYKETPYLYVNLLRYGTGTEHVKSWIDIKNDKIDGIYLQYFDCLHFFTRENQTYPCGELMHMVDFLSPKVVMVQSGMGDRIENALQSHYFEEKNHIIDMDQIHGSSAENDTCRLADASDIPEIVDLLLMDKSYTEVYTRDILLQQMRQRYDDSFSRYFIIVMDGKIVATCSTYGEVPGFSMIGGVMVHPDYRRRGLAGKVEDFACDVLGNERRSRVGFVNYYNQPSLALHLKLGAVPIASLYKFVRRPEQTT